MNLPVLLAMSGSCAEQLKLMHIRKDAHFYYSNLNNSPMSTIKLQSQPVPTR